MSAATEAEKIIPITQAAKELGLSYAMVRRLVSAGRVPSVSLSGIRRVRLSQIRSMLEECPPAA